jgi:GTP-binding protein LepA
MEIIKERLEREHDLDLVVTNPSVDSIVINQTGEETHIQSAAELPDPTQIQTIKEPWIKGELITPTQYLGTLMQLVNSLRGEQRNLSYIDEKVALIEFVAPLANMLVDFYDQLKSATSGYGSFNYDFWEYKAEDLVKVDFLVAAEKVDSLSMIVHRSESVRVGRQVVEKLSGVIPRQLFEISLQAAIGGKFIAREDIKALGKNVTAKLYGGDISRKKKLWAKQKAGKKKMKMIGKVEIPSEAFMVLLQKSD